jgi:hypothetical protein
VVIIKKKVSAKYTRSNIETTAEERVDNEGEKKSDSRIES